MNRTLLVSGAAKRDHSAASAAVGKLQPKSFKQTYREVQASLDTKAKGRMQRLRQSSALDEDEFRGKYATHQLQQAAPQNKGYLGGQLQKKRIMSATNQHQRFKRPSAVATMVSNQNQQSSLSKAFASNTIQSMAIEDLYNVDAGALLNRTLHSKPTTADSTNANIRLNSRAQREKEKISNVRVRLTSGRSGATAGTAFRVLPKKKPAPLNFDQRAAPQSISQPTTAMSNNAKSIKSESYSKVVGSYGKSNSGATTYLNVQQQNQMLQARSNNDQSSGLLNQTQMTAQQHRGEVEMPSDEMLINDDFNGLGAQAIPRAADLQNNRGQQHQQRRNINGILGNNMMMTQQLPPTNHYLTDDAQHGGEDNDEEYSTEKKKAKNSRLIIYGSPGRDEAQPQPPLIDGIGKRQQDSQDKIGVFLADFYEKNRGKAPQVIIDKIRKQIEATRQEGAHLKGKIQNFDKMNAKIRKDTKEQREKTQQALSDKFEIMRDLATYEHNFAIERSERDNMNLEERFANSIQMIKEVRQKCKNPLSHTDCDFQKASLGADGQPTSITEEIEQSQDSNAAGAIAKQGPGFEAHKNYLLNLIAKLESQREQRMTLEKNTFAAIQDGEGEDDLHFILSDEESAKPGLSKFPTELKDLSQNKPEASIYDSRTSIEKKKNKRNQRLVNLVSQGADLTNNPLAVKHLHRSSSKLLPLQGQKSSDLNVGRKTPTPGLVEDGSAKSTARNPCLAINQNFSRDEQLYTRMEISGCDCLVQALFHNGLIKGQVSVASMADQIKFDLHPVLNERFHAVNIFNECKRIYLDVNCSAQGELCLKLLTKSKAQALGDKENKKNFIVKLKGSTNKMSSLEITNNLKDRSFTIHTKVFHTLNLKQQEIFDIKSQNICETFTYEQLAALLGPRVVTDVAQMATINLQVISDFIQKRMCIYQKPDRKYSFVDLRQAEQIFEADLPMISKQLTSLTNTYKHKRMMEFQNNGGAPPRTAVPNARDSPADGVGKNVADQRDHDAFNKAHLVTDFDQAPSEAEQRQEGSSIDQIEKNNGPIDDLTLAGKPMAEGSNGEANLKKMKNVGNVRLVTGAPLLDGEPGRVRRARSVSCLSQPFKMKIIPKELANKADVYANGQDLQPNQLPGAENVDADLHYVRGGLHNSAEGAPGDLSSLPEQGRNRVYLMHSNTEPALQLVDNFGKRHQSVDLAHIRNQQKAQLASTLPTNQSLNQNQHNIVNEHEFNLFKLKNYSREKLVRQDMKELQALEAEMDKYMLFYGKRMINSQKRYRIIANQKIKQKKIDVQRMKDQSILFQEYKMKLKEEFTDCKNRALDQSNYTKRKYHRLAKIYQKNFISLLYESKKVIMTEVETDQDNPAFNILFLFFQIRNQFCMLLGREKKEQEGEDGKDGASCQSDKISKTSSQQNKLIEVDDDSPYFLRITINPQFMYLLDDTRLPTTSEEIAYACKESLIKNFRENRTFKDIVRREVQQMFKERKVIDLQTDLANVIASKVESSGANRKQQDQAQYAQGPAGPAGGGQGGMVGPQHDNVVPERINEESDEDHNAKVKIEGRQGAHPGAPDLMQQINLNIQPKAGGKSLASDTFSRENLAKQDNTNLPSATNLPKLSRDNSQDNSMPDIKSKTNLTGSAEVQAVTPAQKSYGQPSELKGHLPGEAIEEGKNARSERADAAARAANGDTARGAEQTPTSRRRPNIPPSPPDIAVEDQNALQVPTGHAAPNEPPAIPAEMQEFLFEEAMDQVVGNYSIVLNFNS